MRSGLAVGALLLSASVSAVVAATKTVDLDAQPTNGAESKCELNVLSSFPVRIENVVTNNAVGEGFEFKWFSAGPGGFISSVAPGTVPGVGTRWTWTTNQTVYAYSGNNCENDICFVKTAGVGSLGGVCSLSCVDDGVTMTASRGTGGAVNLAWTGGTAAYTIFRSSTASQITNPANAIGSTSTLQASDTPPAGGIFFYRVRASSCLAQKACASNSQCQPASEGVCVSRGPFAVPGRSLSSTDVTVSSSSLTSSLITFFSPPKEVFRATSSAQPGGAIDALTNETTQPVTVVTEAYPPGCCPGDPATDHKLRCGEECVDFLTDPNNCGACGNVCGEGECCSNGVCSSLCSEDRTFCDGLCSDLQNDSEQCGTCGTACGEGTCCQGGSCVSECAPGQLFCNGSCVDPQNDSGNCGDCGVACGDEACCSNGACVGLTACDAGQAFCDGACIDVQNDNDNCGACGNACGEGSCCSNGVCSSNSACEAGRTLCDGLCYDTMNDPNHCGACGNVCGPEAICTNGVCSPCGNQGGRRFACDNTCVNLNTDAYNCGACGNACNLDCPSNFHGACSSGNSCRCEPGPPAPPPPSHIPPPTPPFCGNPDPPDPVPGHCPNPNPSGPVDAVCPNPTPSYSTAAVCPEPGPETAEGTPICTINPATTTLAPGATATFCRPGGLLFKEIVTTIRVCGDSIPGPDGDCQDGVSKVTTGTFMQLAPDTETEIGEAFLTPYAVHVTAENTFDLASNSPTGDGLVQPGETVSILVDVLNAGPSSIQGVTATISAPAVDLTDDGVNNPVGVTILNGTVSYGTILGTQPSANCGALELHPKSGAVPFELTIPDNHPGDTTHPFIITFTGTVNGSPFTMTMPFSLGIADRCVFAEGTRDYDGIDGLSTPLTRLVPMGDPVQFPNRSFNAGNTLPMKMRQLCGGVELKGADADAPQVVGLSEATRGPIDISTVVINDDTSTSDPLFRWNETTKRWIFNMRTSPLGTGVFTLTIRIAGRKDYVTGFVLD
jgi:stigma-specific protein Stig1